MPVRAFARRFTEFHQKEASARRRASKGHSGCSRAAGSPRSFPSVRTVDYGGPRSETAYLLGGDRAGVLFGGLAVTNLVGQHWQVAR